MKKYRVTEKHPELKKNTIIDTNDSNYFIGIGDIRFLIDDSTFNEWIKDGYIEEIQKLEFTRDDMKKAFWSGHNTSLTFDEYINE